MRRLRLTLLTVLGFAFLGLALLWNDDSGDRRAALVPRVTGSEPRWFKGNLHTHSLWSDGDDFPEIVTDWYSRHGYHFLAITDHDKLSEGDTWIDLSRADVGARFGHYLACFGDGWVETRTENGRRQVRLKPLGEFRALFDQAGKFLLIQGEEVTDKFGRLPVHVNVSNLKDVIEPRGGETISETIDNNIAAAQAQARRIGRAVLAHVDHPRFHNAITAEALAQASNARFFEVYNGHPIVSHRGDQTHASVERLWDIANTLRLGEMHAPPLYALATDDAHHYFGPGAEPGRGWIMVRARHLTPESLIRAMEAGEFYASSGVTLRRLDYSPSRRSLEVEVVPEGRARYTIRFLGTLMGYDNRRQPVTNEDGSILAATQRYPGDVGRVLATAEGPVARYVLTGRELYVRAVVTSTLPHKNPSLPDQFQEAWTQPVGWEKWVRPQSPPPVGGLAR